MIGLIALALGACSKELGGVGHDDKLTPQVSLLTWRSPVGGDVKYERAELTFHLENRGGRAVKILDIISGCGCLKPEIAKSVVLPGETLDVVARATPPPIGKKDIQLLVKTDSPVENEIPLVVRLIARRKPPFVYDVFGDLQFRGEYSDSLSREVSLVTYEESGKKYDVGMHADLDFVAVEPLGIVDEDDAADSDLVAGPSSRVVVRSHRFRVFLKRRPPTNSFSGQLTIDHPFDPSLRLTKPILGDLLGQASQLVAIPKVLRMGPADGGSRKITLVASSPTQGIEVEVPEDGSLVVEQGSEAGPRRSHSFLVRLGPRYGKGQGDAVLKFRAGKDTATVRIDFD